MSTDLDLTIPGPAGLFRFVSDLTEAGWQQERKARSRLERWCSQCGQPALFGYGETLTTEGVLACGDLDCRAAAEAAAAGGRDLFGRAA